MQVSAPCSDVAFYLSNDAQQWGDTNSSMQLL
jgi:hypothetical protein